MSSENGWEPAWVGQDALQWTAVPGTTVNLQIRKGQPFAIMRAFAADFNAYVEPLRDRDSACYTPTNSVSTSNHLNGTAMDLNWGGMGDYGHPFHVRGTFNAEQMMTIRQMLTFYEDTIYWGGDWHDPIDEMHWQMGYDTYGNPHTDDFIKRKIRADGFSTFRRSGTAAPAAPVLSARDRYAQAIIGEGKRRGISARGIEIALATALVESNLTMYANASVPESLNIAHEAVGSDYDSVGLFQQRSPMWGTPDVLMDPAKSAGLFYDHLQRLNYDDESNSPGYYAQAVQRSAFPDRYDQHFDDATALYERLVTTTGDDMAAVPQEQWDAVFQALTQKLPSRSIYRTPGEGLIDTGFGMVLNIDAMTHSDLIDRLAKLGDPDAVTRVARTAAGLGAVTDAWAVNHAREVLADIEKTNPSALQQLLTKGA
jgi:hypothetical protein